MRFFRLATSTVGRGLDPAEKPPLLGEGDRVSGGRVENVLFKTKEKIMRNFYFRRWRMFLIKSSAARRGKLRFYGVSLCETPKAAPLPLLLPKKPLGFSGSPLNLCSWSGFLLGDKLRPLIL